jgi:hypothetical protein
MRTILLAAALAASALPAHADPTTWQFSYTGFFVTFDDNAFEGSTHREELQPDTRITGSFTASDGNGDGVINLSELVGFSLDGLDYFNCIANPSPYLRCAIDRFSYSLTGALDFGARTNGNDEFFSGWSSAIVSGDRAMDFHYRYPSGPFDEDSTRTLYWTDETRFSIVPAPVPEPAPAAMAVAGLLLLAGLHRRYSPVPIRRR